MGRIELTKNEMLMLYGLTCFPNTTDKVLSEKLKLKHSTVTAIRHRLKKNDFYKKRIIPRMENIGCKMLAAIYTNFSPLIPLTERVKITGDTIEVFDEIFYSVGAQEKGFSLSLAQDYASIGKINDIRTQTFGGRGLLEDEYPTMVVFPFEISKIYRFFDFSHLLKRSFEIDIETVGYDIDISFSESGKKEFSDTEKNVYCSIIGYPELTDSKIAQNLSVSRHTVSKMRKNFEKEKLIRPVNLPNLKKLGFEILSVYHIRFDPSNAPNMEEDEAASLMSESTIFLASRRFEAFMISVHMDYDDYNKDKTRVLQILKENKWIAENPMIRTYSINELINIKYFKFGPIAKKILACNIEI